MKNIKLSIIIPVYKVEQYLPRCLDSLLSQSLKDIELICINDGSPDGSLDILKTYQKKHGSKIVIIDKKNEGVWRGRKDGVKIAKGEYIGFVDSDDYVRPGFAKKLYDAAVSTDSDIAVCGFSRIDMDTGKTYSNEMCTTRRDIQIDSNIDDILAINGAPWNKIYRAKVLKTMKDLKQPPRILDDMMFLLLAYLNVNKITFIPDNLVCYMVRGTSIVNNIKEEQLVSTYAAMLEVKNIYEKDSRNKIFLPFLESMALLHLGISLMFRVSYDKTCNFKEVLKNNESFLNLNFSGWKNSKFIKISHILREKSPNLKLGIVSLLYKMHLYRLFLVFYRFMIDRLKIDIKW